MADNTSDRGGKVRKRAASPLEKRGGGRSSRAAAQSLPGEGGLVADLRAVVDVVERTVKPGRRPSGRPPLEAACQKLIELVRQRCPGLLPAEPLEAGAAVAPIPVPPKEAAVLVAVAARQAVLTAAGSPVPADADRLPQAVLWQEGPDALLVEVGRIDVVIAEGLVSVTVPVRCDQLPNGRDVVVVDLVLGTPDRPTGLLAAATEPRGPRVVVRRWGEALTALAWQAVLDGVGGVAAAAGRDRDGSVLIPTALTASRKGIAVLAQARHEIDRVRPGHVVLPPSAGATGR